MSTDAIAPDLLAVLTTTVGNPEDAQRLARDVLARQLAACVQIEQIEAHYPWAGSLQQEAEWRLVFKTLPTALPALTARLRNVHPYRVPMLIHNLLGVNADYLAWVRDQVKVVDL